MWHVFLNCKRGIMHRSEFILQPSIIIVYEELLLYCCYKLSEQSFKQTVPTFHQGLGLGLN